MAKIVCVPNGGDFHDISIAVLKATNRLPSASKASPNGSGALTKTLWFSSREIDPRNVGSNSLPIATDLRDGVVILRRHIQLAESVKSDAIPVACGYNVRQPPRELTSRPGGRETIETKGLRTQLSTRRSRERASKMWRRTPR